MRQIISDNIQSVLKTECPKQFKPFALCAFSFYRNIKSFCNEKRSVVEGRSDPCKKDAHDFKGRGVKIGIEGDVLNAGLVRKPIYEKRKVLRLLIRWAVTVYVLF
ncbi:hypothetical protein TNCT_192931 [Trichonephila clavata]|uniref:Uncharacterized protein n=1 Tax=Trichonephila clavata TaxID=2740835 RepID=A0A8X6K633_TRICU|nr:hypothetical protein TNCT_192931 [Trichonephila clavata]